MQPMFNGSGGGGVDMLAILAVLWGLAVTLFWMVCAWRAMRAHEKLAESVEQISRKQTGG
jgi:hypothetical protein